MRRTSFQRSIRKRVLVFGLFSNISFPPSATRSVTISERTNQWVSGGRLSAVCVRKKSPPIRYDATQQFLSISNTLPVTSVTSPPKWFIFHFTSHWLLPIACGLRCHLLARPDAQMHHHHSTQQMLRASRLANMAKPNKYYFNYSGHCGSFMIHL